MPMNFKKHNRKYRGDRHHGWGVHQHRKTGRKHGKGETTHWKKGMKSKQIVMAKLGHKTGKWGKNQPNPWIFGKHGFHRPQTVKRLHKINMINIGSLEAKIDGWVEKELATKSGSTYEIDLANVNIQKVLAKGVLKKKINVTVFKASAFAIEEIEKAGGKVTTTFVPKEE